MAQFQVIPADLTYQHWGGHPTPRADAARTRKMVPRPVTNAGGSSMWNPRKATSQKKRDGCTIFAIHFPWPQTNCCWEKASQCWCHALDFRLPHEQKCPLAEIQPELFSDGETVEEWGSEFIIFLLFPVSKKPTCGPTAFERSEALAKSTRSTNRTGHPESNHQPSVWCFRTLLVGGTKMSTSAMNLGAEGFGVAITASRRFFLVIQEVKVEWCRGFCTTTFGICFLRVYFIISFTSTDVHPLAWKILDSNIQVILSTMFSRDGRAQEGFYDHNGLWAWGLSDGRPNGLLSWCWSFLKNVLKRVPEKELMVLFWSLKACLFHVGWKSRQKPYYAAGGQRRMWSICGENVNYLSENDQFYSWIFQCLVIHGFRCCTTCWSPKKCKEFPSKMHHPKDSTVSVEIEPPCGKLTRLLGWANCAVMWQAVADWFELTQIVRKIWGPSHGQMVEAIAH